MAAIDSVGAFRGKITESAVGLTKKSGFPQAILRLEAAEKYIGELEEVKFFQENGEPDFKGGWHAWPVEDLVGYFVLFNGEPYSKETALLSYEQIQVATGWDGTSFDAFGDGSLIGKPVLFRVQENTYDGKTNLQASWIDAFDADPERKLKSLDLGEIKKLNAKLQIVKPAAKPVAAKAEVAPPKPSPTPAPASGPTPSATSPKTSPTVKPAPSATSKPPKATPIEESAKNETLGLPKAVSQESAWASVCQNKGELDDKDVEGAWIAACGEVSTHNDTRPAVEEEKFTDKDWAQVRDTVFKDLDIKPKLH